MAIDSSPWLKSVLVTFWVIEMIWLAWVFVTSCIIVDGWKINLKYPGEQGTWSRHAGTAIAALIIALISFALDVAAILLYRVRRYTLKPKTYLIFQCVKSVFWTYYFAITFFWKYSSLWYGGLQFVSSAPLFATSTGQLAYGSVIMHRQRKGKLHHSMTEHGSVSGDHDTPPRGSYTSWNPTDSPQHPPSYPGEDSKGARTVSPTPSASSSVRPMKSDDAAARAYYSVNAAEQSYELQGTAYRA
ncbi:hypothetical protein B0A50_08010 [Salinomyces thailandicus]|uniref:Uncharacterized protein n=1 Tax=Salinomyces thailandicus TaxID=706561 RepID=A0A4U0TKZ1_9PEZI|nr:hypothetical protein B0A50_08010 [Salinomyces thailandica]